jgi:hypothetical protein
MPKPCIHEVVTVSGLPQDRKSSLPEKQIVGNNVVPDFPK